MVPGRYLLDTGIPKISYAVVIEEYPCKFFVLVQLPGDRSIVGFLRYNSYEQEDMSLLLEYAAWIVDEEGTQSQIEGSGILLTKKSGIESATFLNTGKNEPRGKS